MATLLAIPKAANITRDIYDKENNYRDLIFQKGKVVLDAELNEWQEIARYRQELIAKLIGSIFIGNAFKIVQASTPTNDFQITNGEAYIKGIHHYLVGSTPYSGQSVPESHIRKLLWCFDPDTTEHTVPDLTTPVGDRDDLVVLSCILREVDSTEDINLKDPTLGKESAIRWKLELGVSVLEGYTGDIEDFENSFTYYNTTGCWRVPIAWLHRLDGQANIYSAMIEDIRAEVFAASDTLIDRINTFVSNLYSYIDAGLAAQNEFTELDDTPAAYTDHARKLVSVKSDESALEFPSGVKINPSSLYSLILENFLGIGAENPSSKDVRLDFHSAAGLTNGSLSLRMDSGVTGQARLIHRDPTHANGSHVFNYQSESKLLAMMWHSTNATPDYMPSTDGRISSGKIYNAVWNDIAETVPSDGRCPECGLLQVDLSCEYFRVKRYDGDFDAIVGIRSMEPGYIVGWNDQYVNPVFVGLKGMLWFDITDWAYLDSSLKGKRLYFTRDGRVVFGEAVRSYSPFDVYCLGTVIAVEGKKVKLFV